MMATKSHGTRRASLRGVTLLCALLLLIFPAIASAEEAPTTTANEPAAETGAVDATLAEEPAPPQATEEEPVPPPEPQGPVACAATGNEAVVTDKADYAPEETVHITGTGFAASCDVVVKVTRPDGSVVIGDGSFTEGSDTVATDENGSLVYDYILDGILGQYLVEAIGADGVVLTSVTFTDAPTYSTRAAPLWAPASSSAKFVFLFRQSNGTTASPTSAADSMGCVKLTVPTEYTNVSAPPGEAYAGPSKTWTTPSVSGQVVTFASPGAANRLRVAGDWARLEIDVTTPAAASSNRWPATVYSDTACSQNPVSRYFSISSGPTANTRTATVVGTKISPAGPVYPGDTVTYQVKVTNTTTPLEKIRIVDVVLPRCFDQIGVATGSMTTNGLGTPVADITDGVIRVTISSPPADRGLAQGQWLQFQFTARAGADPNACLPGTYPFLTGVSQEGPANTTDTIIPTWIPDTQPTIEIVKIPTTSATEVHKPDHTDVTGGYVVAGTSIHDELTVSGIKNSIPIGGTADFSLYNNGTCTAGADNVNRVNFWDDVAVTAGVAETTDWMAVPGVYSFKASYNGSAYYDTSAADCEKFTVLPKAAVTSSSLCEFDVDCDLAGKQFRLIYTPEMQSAGYKLNASNPGQFFYNAFIDANGPTTLNIEVPYPFVTQGAMPVHIYSGVTPTYKDGKWCFTPGTLLEAEDDQIVLNGTGPQTISVDFDATGIVYVAVHLDYGLKKTLAYSKDAISLKATGVAGTPAAGTTILNKASYVFSDDLGGSDTVQNLNEFKKDPGIGGLVLKTNGDPVADTPVEIWLSGKKMATVKTDADGWYMWNYKYTGKAATFTIKLPAFNLSQSVTLKSNGYLVVHFTV